MGLKKDNQQGSVSNYQLEGQELYHRTLLQFTNVILFMYTHFWNENMHSGHNKTRELIIIHQAVHITILTEL